MIRYYAETPCEHGSMAPHPTTEGIKSDRIDLRAGGRGLLSGVTRGMSYEFDCPGGRRRELTGVEVVEWCEEHGSVVRDGWLTCLHAFFAANVKTECRPASRLLVNPPGEGEG